MCSRFTGPNLAVPDGIRLVHLPPHGPEVRPAETLRPLVDEPIVDKLVPSLDDLVNTTGPRRCDVAGRQAEISSRNDSAWWPKNHTPS